MKRLLALVIALTLLSAPILCEQPAAAGDVYEYVFSEAELKAFLAENIDEAVKKNTADLARQYAIDSMLKDQALKDETARADDLSKELGLLKGTTVVYVTVGVAAGLGLGYLLGKVF